MHKPIILAALLLPIILAGCTQIEEVKHILPPEFFGGGSGPQACNSSSPCVHSYWDSAVSNCINEPLSGEQPGCSGTFGECQRKECENGQCIEKPIVPCCGNGSCESYESCSSCQRDCGTCKADGASCASAGECAGGYCVNSYCRSTSYYCGDGSCDSGEDCTICEQDCGRCKKNDGESCSSSDECLGNYCVHNYCRSSSTYCGDTQCDSGESCSNCQADCGACGPRCGNGSCESGENCSSCPSDCGSCAPRCVQARGYCGDGTEHECCAGLECIAGKCTDYGVWDEVCNPILWGFDCSYYGGDAFCIDGRCRDCLPKGHPCEETYPGSGLDQDCCMLECQGGYCLH